MNDYEYDGPEAGGHQVLICLEKTEHNLIYYPDVMPGQIGFIEKPVTDHLINVIVDGRRVLVTKGEIGEIGDPVFERIIAEATVESVMGE